MLKSKGKRRNRILFLVDFDNLTISAKKNIAPTEFSIESGFRKVIEEITEEVGEIIGIFAFLPPDKAMLWGADLDQWGFHAVSCPKVKNKEGVEQDTTDRQLMELGEWLINHLDNLTHLCIGSGDKDFSPLMMKAALKGLKKMVVAADIRSLSARLIELTDKKSTGGKMVYLFSPIKE